MTLNNNFNVNSFEQISKANGKNSSLENNFNNSIKIGELSGKLFAENVNNECSCFLSKNGIQHVATFT